MLAPVRADNLTSKALYRVTVRHNIVCAIRRVDNAGGADVSRTKLEASTQLAKNNQENGCIDGDYYFEDAGLAKSFAILSLDFVKRLLEKTLDEIQNRAFSGEFDWGNPRLPRD